MLRNKWEKSQLIACRWLMNGLWGIKLYKYNAGYIWGHYYIVVAHFHN
jgi:hypothetical protein